MKNLHFAFITLTLLFLNGLSARAQTLPTPTRPLPPLSQWKIGGGALNVAPDGNGFRIGPPGNAEWGNCYSEGDVDVDATPYLALLITEVGRDAKWLLTVNDAQVHSLEGDGQCIGLRVYDLRKAPANYQGRKHCRIYLTVQGAGKRVVIGGIGLFANSPAPVSVKEAVSAPYWTRMNNSLANLLPDGGVNLAINEAASDQWGGLIAKMSVDTDQYPLIESEMTERTPGARWRVTAGGVASGPEHEMCGTVAFNYRDFSSAQGKQEVEVQVTCTRIGGGQVLHMGKTHFVSYPTASEGLVRQTERIGPLATFRPLLTTGDFQIGYDSEARLFRIQRKDSAAILVTRFLEMPGFDLSPQDDLKPTKTPAGTRLEYRVVSQGVAFAVLAETRNNAPGLLHWRVMATPQRPARFASCGHELAYISLAGAANKALKRIALQNLSASGLAYATAPGLGNVFYFQNFTALNPAFQTCHTSPRWLVSAGNKTFGFANPLDTSVTFPAGKAIVLSDAYLCLNPQELVPTESGPTGERSDNTAQADRLLQALAIVYDALPDKPETEWYDWQALARQSLHDLNAGDCWRAYGKRNYIQGYVGVRGCVPQITPIQDILAPLTYFQAQSGEGGELAAKLRDCIPDFWSEERKSLKEVAMPGDHIWYNIPNYVTLSRAALAGDTAVKPFCLKGAAAMIQLAHETNYLFNAGPAGQLFGIPENAELAGPYLLYMTLCHELAPDDTRFLKEAQQAAATIKRWRYRDARETFWTAMACEGLGRLYAATGDPEYVRISSVPLASLMRNVFFWESDIGYARSYRTFCGVNSDASGIDYIAAMEQHQIWYSLREYLRSTHSVLPEGSQTLVAEFLRYAPATIWYAYPVHLPADSLFTGETFWKTDSNYLLQIPVEDLNTGLKKNGSVGQEIYGAGAVFTIASQNYTPVREAGLLIYSEYPLQKISYDTKQKSLLLEVGGVSRYASKIEVRPLEAPGKTGVFPWSELEAVKARCAVRQKNGTVAPAAPLLLKTVHLGEKADSVTVLRTTAPGNSFVRLFLANEAASK